MDLADLGKTPWIDRLFQQFVERITRVNPDAAPLLMPTKKLRVMEYGCGHYGCALPTTDPEVVIKITTDPTEAAFAVIARKLGDQPEGVVRYHHAYAVDFKLRGKPAFVLWRQTAYRVSALEVFNAGRDSYQREKLQALIDNLTQYRGIAIQVRGVMVALAATTLRATTRWSYLAQVEARAEEAEELIETIEESSRLEHIPRGTLRTAAEFRVLRLLEEEMSNTAGSDLIGDALAYYRERGLLLADVHANNVGHRAETDSPLGGIIITDPGHAVALVEKWASVEIPDLPQ